MFNFLSFLISLLHSIPFKHAIHFLACITLDLISLSSVPLLSKITPKYLYSWHSSISLSLSTFKLLCSSPIPPQLMMKMVVTPMRRVALFCSQSNLNKRRHNPSIARHAATTPGIGSCPGEALYKWNFRPTDTVEQRTHQAQNLGNITWWLPSSMRMRHRQLHNLARHRNGNLSTLAHTHTSGHRQTSASDSQHATSASQCFMTLILVEGRHQATRQIGA